MATKNETTSDVNAITRISAGTVFKGEINSPNDIRIDGQFEGKIISSGRVVIGENAMVKGDIISADIDVWGTVEGNISAKDMLSFKSGCSIKGNIQVHRLSVELDSEFNGSSKMISEEEYESLVAQPKEEE